MKKIKNRLASVLFALAAFYMTSCQTTAPVGPDASANATVTDENAVMDTLVRYSPQRVDVRGTITQREYNQGQMLILVEGITDQNTRFSRAVVLVTPITQIVGLNGRTISLSELQNGQQVAIMFRGRYRESVSGFSAQAVARKMWIEPLGGY
ncbi:hypothetical protein ACFSC6_17875 [Rufibacter sediminis]|uniref:Lipoprotein n=1 Tax=Rufibacter sediminis TaxID=2762756 RepID=A0ABR6VR55_9BACT|nr:hypothetical protein [Rufibacter sediminis]MBC3539392.1 hypothetical protein [Rufibacter sediminis]